MRKQVFCREPDPEQLRVSVALLTEGLQQLLSHLWRQRNGGKLPSSTTVFQQLILEVFNILYTDICFVGFFKE